MRSTPDRAQSELAEREAALLAQGQTPIGQQPAAEDAAAAPAGAPLDLSRLMENPQVKAAITGAVAEAVAKIMADLAAKREIAGLSEAVADGHTDRAFAEKLALTIGELIDQGRPGSRRAVAPAVLAQRSRSREAMTDAILRCRAERLSPEYETRQVCYLSEERVHPTFIGSDKKTYATRFSWPGVPNEAMVPMNQAAAEIHRHFLDSIGHVPLPAPSDPLVEGFRVLRGPTGDPVGPPQLGNGRPADGELRVINREPVHILGTIAEPARPPVQ